MAAGIGKSRTGIEGFDELTLGGTYPDRTAHFGLRRRGLRQDAVRLDFPPFTAPCDLGEPGVFVTFEERPPDIVNNVASLRGSASTDLYRPRQDPHRARCGGSRRTRRNRRL